MVMSVLLSIIFAVIGIFRLYSDPQFAMQAFMLSAMFSISWSLFYIGSIINNHFKVKKEESK